MKLRLLAAAATMVVPFWFTASAWADDSKLGIYEVTEIYILPSAMQSKADNIIGRMKQMVSDTEKDPGLLSLKVTQQVAEQNNFTVVEQWKDQASLDGHMAAEHTRKFYADMKDLMSGPVYQRVFSVYQ
jgi:quinol monooxygenase YgiN